MSAKEQQQNKVDNKQFKERGSPLMFMTIISWILITANKIPLINKLTKMLSIYYGKTTFWRMLILIRKAFITINAIIGVITVFKISGIGYDSIMAGFSGMGMTYIEMLSNLSKRLFNWFLRSKIYLIIK